MVADTASQMYLNGINQTANIAGNFAAGGSGWRASLTFSPIVYETPYLPESAALRSGRSSSACLEHACGALGRKPCVFRHLRRFATTTGEKVGLAVISHKVVHK